MENPKISVVVPVYGVESYLDRCVKSLIEQTYQNLEIILVDDGSPDNCPTLCDAWAKKDSRIQVIHKKNGGLSDARNTGMAVASGELLSFIDSDDWAEQEMYELLVQHLQEDDADISACGVIMDWEDGTPSRMLTKEGSCVLSGEEAMAAVVAESWLKQPVWYKLYRTAQIREIPFAVGKYHEDVFWTYQAVGKAKRVTVFDVPCYHYVQRSGSIMGVGYSIKRLDALEAKRQRLDYLKKIFPSVLPLAQEDFLFSCLYHGQMAVKYLPETERKKTLDVVQKLIRSCAIPSGLSVTHGMWLRMSKGMLEMTCMIRNRLHIGN